MEDRIKIILDSGTAELFESVIRNQISKPLAYYNSLDEAVGALKTQGYGRVEILPLGDKRSASYITIRIDSEDNKILNLITYGWKKPEEGETRPFSIEGAETWQVGDIIYNTDYLLNSVLGWMCIEEGTPGIWKSFGLLGEKVEDSTTGENIYITNQLAYYEKELPSVSKGKLGKIILYAEDDYSGYEVYYCNKFFTENKDIFYKWDLINQGDSKYLKIIDLGVDEESTWVVNRFKNCNILEDEDFRNRVKDSCILLGRVPNVSKDNQRLRIGDKEYILKYEEEQEMKLNDFKKDSIIAIKFNPKIAYSNQNYLYIDNIPNEYYLRKFSEILDELEQKIEEKTVQLNTKITDIKTNMTLMSTTLLDRINSINSTLTDRIDSLNQEIELIQSKLETE